MSFIIDGTCEFIHIPKTAGVWIENVCKPWIEIAGTNHDRGGRHSGALTKMRSFAVAREPYSWMQSCVGYTQKRWIIVEKNYPGWFLQCEYKRIGRDLKTLRIKNVHVNKVLEEYLKKMPGEYSRATLTWYENADRLVNFGHLHDDLMATLRAFKCPHAHRIEVKAKNTEPMNTSKDKQTQASPELIQALREAEHEWYDHTKGGQG
ncbi:MAG TPA: hypothetical protein VMW79_07950 [Anaerolineae bacterium]|nr:hypothetical protein [Anaerolineae bacterium]